MIEYVGFAIWFVIGVVVGASIMYGFYALWDYKEAKADLERIEAEKQKKMMNNMKDHTAVNKAIVGMRYNGCVTTEAQAEYIHKHGHLLGIIQSDHIFKERKDYYYIMSGLGYKIIYENNHPVQVFMMNADDAKKIVECSKLFYGGF